MFIAVSSKRSSERPCRGTFAALLGWTVVYLLSIICTLVNLWHRLLSSVFVQVWPLQGFFKRWLPRSHCRCGTSDHRTMNCQLVHPLLFIEGCSPFAILPHQHRCPLCNYRKMGLWPLTCSGGKNFKRNIVNMCVLITTVITTKYPHSPSLCGFTA